MLTQERKESMARGLELHDRHRAKVSLPPMTPAERQAEIERMTRILESQNSQNSSRTEP